MRCCCGRSRSPGRARSSPSARRRRSKRSAPARWCPRIATTSDIRDRSKSFDGLAAFTYVTAGFATDPRAMPKLKMGMLVSGNLFPLMGVEPTIGRAFRPEEDQVPGPRRASSCSAGRCGSRNSDPTRPCSAARVRINGGEFTVIGVAPPEFRGHGPVRALGFLRAADDVAAPDERSEGPSLEARDARDLRVKGRLKAGVTQAEAQTELTAIAADLERAYPDTNKNRSLAVRTELQARLAQDPPDAMLIAMLSTLALARAVRRLRQRRRAVDQPRARFARARWRCASPSAPDAGGWSASW